LGPAGAAAAAAAEELDQNINVIKAAATTACWNIKQRSFKKKLQTLKKGKNSSCKSHDDRQGLNTYLRASSSSR